MSESEHGRGGTDGSTAGSRTGRGGDGLGEEEQRERDTAYSPASERETEQLQREPEKSPALAQDVDGDAVQTLPGTGGPDDPGATRPAQEELDPAEIARRGER